MYRSMLLSLIAITEPFLAHFYICSSLYRYIHIQYYTLLKSVCILCCYEHKELPLWQIRIQVKLGLHTKYRIFELATRAVRTKNFHSYILLYGNPCAWRFNPLELEYLQCHTGRFITTCCDQPRADAMHPDIHLSILSRILVWMGTLAEFWVLWNLHSSLHVTTWADCYL